MHCKAQKWVAGVVLVPGVGAARCLLLWGVAVHTIAGMLAGFGMPSGGCCAFLAVLLCCCCGCCRAAEHAVVVRHLHISNPPSVFFPYVRAASSRRSCCATHAGGWCPLQPQPRVRRNGMHSTARAQLLHMSCVT